MQDSKLVSVYRQAGKQRGETIETKHIERVEDKAYSCGQSESGV